MIKATILEIVRAKMLDCWCEYCNFPEYDPSPGVPEQFCPRYGEPCQFKCCAQCSHECKTWKTRQ